jgi:putative lipoprotein
MYRNGLAALALLYLTACGGADRLDGTRWLTEYIDERGVIDFAQTTLEFVEPGRAAGRGGCNRWSASVEIRGSTIQFGDAITTKMACVEALMDQENRFLAALQASRSFRVKDQKLVLLDAQGKERVSLTPMS